MLKDKKQMDTSKVDINEGTISFWIKPGKIIYNDGKAAPLIQLNPKGGSIFMVKDSDNKVKFFHVKLDKGRTDIEHDVSNLDPNAKHMFAVTWSVKNSKIILYIDGEPVSETTINYS